MNLTARRRRLLRRGLVGGSLASLALSVVVMSGNAVVSAQNTTSNWPADVFAVGAVEQHGTAVPGNVACAVVDSVACIQQAVNEAEAWAAANTPAGGPVPATYVLLAPGDYKTDPAAIEPAPPGQDPAGVLVTGANVWIVGTNRNSVVVDGTKSGPPCSSAPQDQVFGPASAPEEGLNGIMVFQAPGSWVENLTVCNFLNGTGGDGGGNQIWWNGGANSGKVFVDTQGPRLGDSQGGYVGKYLTATNTFFGTNPAQPSAGPETWAGTYGIFSSNWDGGRWEQTYASNFNDSGYYIGACQDECNQEVDEAHAEYNALGYSGSNSGGWLLVEHSTFDNNEDGFDTNSQNGDNPPPQDGACPPGVSPPVEGAPTCWVFYKNNSYSNNDPDVPTYGSAAAGPVGTGMSLSGARDDTVLDNRFENNNAWGTILVPYPDSGDPCTGGTLIAPDSPSTPLSGALCWFDEYGDAVLGNTYVSNGGWGNPTNGDIAAVNAEPGPTDCFAGNSDPYGLTTSPPLAELLYPKCTGMTVPPDVNALFTDEVACDSGSIQIGPVTGSTACLPGANYPRQTQVQMHPLPGASSLTAPESSALPTMSAPCSDVPTNPWC